ncbi:MAG TPA: hypothetical protein VG798_00975 [Rhizomicrobium sp.]|nr:hypothetical protein [Rhizomicrobium sp.]HWC00630.1 hypothetical protein [Bryobacteraceae bacterium]
MIWRGCILLMALSLLGGAAFAADDSRETVTVTGQSPVIGAMTADLDPTRTHFGGLTGEKISRDIDPLDRYSAFREFARGLSGPLGEWYNWHGLRDDGHFRPTREFYEAGLLCRDFTEETVHRQVEVFPPQAAMDVRPPLVLGTACREEDGWHFR